MIVRRCEAGARARATLAAIVAIGLGCAAAPALAAAPTVPITLGIHDGAINKCDRSGKQTKPPTAAELAAAASSFSNQYWPALRVSAVRFSPPWDIAYHHDGPANSKANKELAVNQACFDAWLAGAQRAGAQPEIAFKPDPNFHSPNGAFLGVPGINTYRLAIDAFTAEYSNAADTAGRARVQIISPWGEPDFRAKKVKNRIFMPKGGHLFSDPNCHGSPNVNTCGPILAGQMWQAVRAGCTVCTLPGLTAGSGVVAGDFSSLGGIRGHEGGPGGRLRGSYLDVYRSHLNGNRPVVWGVHPYSDITAFETAQARHAPVPRRTLVGAFARNLRAVGYHQHTQIWLNEISAFQGHGMGSKPEPAWTPAVQAAAGHYLLFGLPKAASGAREPTVTRAYYLNFQAADPINSRWALVLGGGTRPQPIYNTFVQR